MEVIRSYYNASDDLIRVDRLQLQIATSNKGIITYTGDGTKTIGKRKLTTQSLHVSTGGTPGTPVSRVVDKLEVIGDYNELETTSAKYQWAKWERGDGTDYILDMSDLPGCGDTV